MEERALPTALRLMLAAGRRELASLQELVTICEVVTLASQLVHDLQKERGWSGMWLGEAQPDRLAVLEGFSASAGHSEQQLRRCLDGMDLAGGVGRPRLLARAAHALDALDGLPRLRRRIRDRGIDGSAATMEFTRLIGGLLSVVFEAADGGLDPAVSRALVAMFSFMQGKELAGQERATGVAGFTAGWFDAARQEQMHRLQEGQQRCLASFGEAASPEVRAQWARVQENAAAAQRQRLRAVAGRTSPAERVGAPLAELWFESCTRQIDAMKEVENLLAEDLLHTCRQSIARARADVESRRQLSRRIATLPDAGQPLLFRVQASPLDDPMSTGGSEELNRSILDRVQDQSRRLQQLDEELAKTRRALEDRRRIDTAKRQLEAKLGLSEQEAHQRLQRASMHSGVPLGDLLDSTRD